MSLVFNACEKDDICLSSVTPKLILRFYDAANPSTLKSVQNISVWVQGKDTLSNYKSANLDSIAIPLNTNASQTVYNIKKNSVNGNIVNNSTNQLTITYTTEDVYVSRSCGFKTIFNTVTITASNGWVQSFTPSTLTTINNETKAHVKIFH